MKCINNNVYYLIISLLLLSASFSVNIQSNQINDFKFIPYSDINISHINSKVIIPHSSHKISNVVLIDSSKIPLIIVSSLDLFTNAYPLNHTYRNDLTIAFTDSDGLFLNPKVKVIPLSTFNYEIYQRNFLVFSFIFTLFSFMTQYLLFKSKYILKIITPFLILNTYFVLVSLNISNAILYITTFSILVLLSFSKLFFYGNLKPYLKPFYLVLLIPLSVHLISFSMPKLGFEIIIITSLCIFLIFLLTKKALIDLITRLKLIFLTLFSLCLLVDTFSNYFNPIALISLFCIVYAMFYTAFMYCAVLQLRENHKTFDINLNKAIKKAYQQDRIQTISLFGKGLIHEIKTPLSWLSSALEILQESTSPKDIKFSMELLKECRGRLSSTLDDVAIFTIIENSSNEGSFWLSETITHSKRFLLLCMSVENNVDPKIMFHGDLLRYLQLFIYLFSLSYSSSISTRQHRDPGIIINSLKNGHNVIVTWTVNGDGLCEQVYKGIVDPNNTHLVQRSLLFTLMGELVDPSSFALSCESDIGERSRYILEFHNVI
jgi:hypothetical protein